jgi:MGT family glycosyltransferase
MARIAFVTWDGGGNVGPAIGIAQALATRGHRIHFLGYEVQRDRIEGQGFTFSALERSGDFDAHGRPPEDRIPALLRHVWACPEHREDIPAALAKHSSDVLVVDFMMQGALAAQERLAIPVVALVHSAVAGLVPPSDSPVGATWLAASNALRASADLAPMRRLNDAWDRLLTLVTTIPELDPAAADRGNRVRYVGPIVEQFAECDWQSPWDAGDRRPLVLVSFSTTRFWDQGGRIRNTLAALAEEPVRVLVSAPEAAQLGPLPANAIVHDFVPHALVLPHTAVTVTHCGHGTVTGSLAHGVPLVGMPNNAADQPFLAQRLQQLGAGVALDGDAAAAEIRTAVREVLAKPSYAAAARELQAAIRASPGAAGAAGEVERTVLGTDGKGALPVGSRFQ